MLTILCKNEKSCKWKVDNTFLYSLQPPAMKKKIMWIMVNNMNDDVDS